MAGSAGDSGMRSTSLVTSKGSDTAETRRSLDACISSVAEASAEAAGVPAPACCANGGDDTRDTMDDSIALGCAVAADLASADSSAA